FDVCLPVLVEVDIGMRRCGGPPGEPAVELARQGAGRRHLRFARLQAYHRSGQHRYDFEERRRAIETALGLTPAPAGRLAAGGLACAIVSGAGTGTCEFEARSGVYNEIQAGSYIFMDADYRRVAGFPAGFENALFVLATVLKSTPERAVVDAGQKAYSVD